MTDALADLEMSAVEQRPTELARLRQRIERNLSGLVGPLLAHMIVEQRLGTDNAADTALASNVRFIGQRLEASNTRLRGLTAELDTLRRYHRQILQDLPVGVCSLGPDQEVVIWNLAMELASGIPRRQVTGMHLEQLPAPWGSLLAGFLNTRDQHVRKKRVVVQGQSRWFDLRQSSVEDPAQGFLEAGGTVLLVEDLTDLQTLEAELAHSERLASIGRLAAGVAHEIGNPVTGIACLAQNMQAEDDEALRREGLEAILHQTRRISAIAESLVSFSHSGTVADHRPEPLGLRDCMEDAIRLVRLSQAGKQLSFDIHADPALVILGDRQRLSQVFVSLLTNACDASKPGQHIEMFAGPDGAGVRMEVRDHGEGIADDLRGRIFEPFFTTKAPGHGTGLGLPIVYNIVQEHGGEISIESLVGAGTRVVIRLPAPCIVAAGHDKDNKAVSNPS